MKLITLYRKWMKTGEMRERTNAKGHGGLCNCLPEEYLSDLEMLFRPKTDNLGYWASGTGIYGTYESSNIFTPLRQYIVLLICAMHNEI